MAKPRKYYRVNPFDYGLMKKNSENYSLLWQYVRELKLSGPDGKCTTLELWEGQNLDQEIDRWKRQMFPVEAQ